MSNFTALRAAVFPLSTKTLREADIRRPPLSSVRGLKLRRQGGTLNGFLAIVPSCFRYRELKFGMTDPPYKPDII